MIGSEWVSEWEESKTINLNDAHSHTYSNKANNLFEKKKNQIIAKM